MNSQRWETINYRQTIRRALTATLVLGSLVSLVSFGAAQEVRAKSEITIAQLAGPWQLGFVGNTGCGISAALFTGTLNASGVATGTFTGASACGTSSSTQTLTITSLNANGSGTAGLTCGTGCGWTFNIQVSLNRQVFNMVDVTDPNNWLAGSAVKQ